MSDSPIESVPHGTESRGDNEKHAILVVDDERRIADTLALILRSKGYLAEAAYNAPAAIERYRELRPALVISDVMMPGMNGIEMAIAICHEFVDCRILLFSGQGATVDLMEDARKRGHEFELLAKPIHPEQLLDKVGQLIGPADSCGSR